MALITRRDFVDRVGALDLDADGAAGTAADQRLADTYFERLAGGAAGLEDRALDRVDRSAAPAVAALLDAGAAAQHRGDTDFAERAYGLGLRAAPRAFAGADLPKADLAARAAYNLALLREERGDLAGALALVRPLCHAPDGAPRPNWRVHLKVADLMLQQIAAAEGRGDPGRLTVRRGAAGVEVDSERLAAFAAVARAAADALATLDAQRLDPEVRVQALAQASQDLARAAGGYRGFAAKVQAVINAQSMLGGLQGLIARGRLPADDPALLGLKQAVADPAAAAILAAAAPDADGRVAGASRERWQLWWTEWLFLQLDRGRALVPGGIELDPSVQAWLPTLLAPLPANVLEAARAAAAASDG